jgi:hypothetical protein
MTYGSMPDKVLRFVVGIFVKAKIKRDIKKWQRAFKKAMREE